MHTLLMCVAQAAKCGELERIARSTKDMFNTPPGVVLPFGCMESSLAAAGADKEFKVCVDVWFGLGCGCVGEDVGVWDILWSC